MKKILVLFSIVCSGFAFSCKENATVFTLAQEKDLGLQVKTEIESTPAEYPILPRVGNEKAYQYVENIMYSILESKDVNHKKDFDWELTIINKNVLNAFASPGGKLFFYTGFLKYAESEAELAGVMAHEIAHSDRRHSTNTMTKSLGISVLIQIALGKDPGTLGSLVGALAQNGMDLRFSRKHEYEADEYSVRYLNSIRGTKTYDPTAIMDFFDHMKRDSLSTPNGNFEFLRTHPYDDNRKENVNKVWQKLGSPAGQKYTAEYTAFKQLLP
ncbi:MAG: M48 family metalloprotease [Bacteroidales bacterium]|jgi:predicted Zn-dependent protease|nr:M48 family metalloprotease [Bacteroidales bacterium]